MLTFRVGEQTFALATEGVHEVARMPPLSRVPHAPASLLGLANLRGSVIPVLSMARMLNAAETSPTRIIVIEAGEVFGLAVDEASQLLGAGQVGAVHKLDVTELIARHLPAKVQRRSGGTSIASRRETDSTTETVALLAFAIGDQEFALPLAAVEEILPLPRDIAVMPDADEVVVGSAASRGTVLPLLSLRALLALPFLGASDRTRVVVVRIGHHRVGLLVDAMRTIMRVPETMIDVVPPALNRSQAEARIQAICRLDEGERLVSVLAADHLLRDDITARLMQGAGEEREMRQASGDATSEQFLVFRIGAEEFGIAIGSVEEVAPLPAKLTRLPKAPAFVKGVMNLRGQVIPVIDQAQRFGGAASTAERRRVIVVRIDDLHAGFLVDAVSEVVAVDAEALVPAPELGNEQTRVFERVANLPDQQRMILIVSPRELLDRVEQDLLRSLGKKSAKHTS